MEGECAREFSLFLRVGVGGQVEKESSERSLKGGSLRPTFSDEAPGRYDFSPFQTGREKNQRFWNLLCGF